jgi:hypothetical protein
VDYEPISLVCLIGSADTVAVGRVTRDRAGKYWVLVEQMIAGAKASGRRRLDIAEWQGPTSRSPGRALLFLRTGRGKAVEVLGPSLEGWLPIQGERLRIEGVVLPGKPSVEPAVRHEVAPILSALRWTARCVRWRRTPRPARVVATIQCHESSVESVRRESSFARQLLSALEGQREFPCFLANATPRR